MSAETKIRQYGQARAEFWLLAHVDNSWKRVAVLNTLALAQETEKSYHQILEDGGEDGARRF